MKKLIVVVAALFLSSALQAQTSNGATVPGSSLGASIAQKGNQNGAAACVACHGTKGEGKAENGYPNLSGQPVDYMVKQLNDYASGVRNNPVMGPIAKALSMDEKIKVSEFYSQMARAVSPFKNANASLVKVGEKLATVGDQKMQLQACNNCHGPGGVGLAPLIPALAGQHSSYIEAQLQAWKKGQRKNSPLQMLQVVERLDEKSIKALAAYFEQVKVK